MLFSHTLLYLVVIDSVTRASEIGDTPEKSATHRLRTGDNPETHPETQAKRTTCVLFDFPIAPLGATRYKAPLTDWESRPKEEVVT
jgi:hypothetical protein